MVSSLQLSTSGEDTSKTSTTLPSFGDLIKSLQSPEEQHGLQNPSHPPHSHAHAHRREPYPTHGHFHHDIPPRSPSTPPDASRSFSQQQGPSPVSHHISHPHIPRGRPRSNTAPSFSNTHLSSPFSHHRHLANTEHCADRVRALKDGDGEWSIFDSVAPSVLPYHARPHLHSRASTPHSSSPSPSCETFSHIYAHHSNAASPPPCAMYRPYHSRTPSLSSQSYTSHSSPLSNGAPLTPKSIQSVYDDVELRRSCTRTPTPTYGLGIGSEKLGGAKEAREVKIPQLPRMR
ncbi:hypothetical protein B9479_006595 [Cryptococcus floricola]|uniref:Uncharacterized protein n=1 Tax=Cryptococcus floricola TaxID=2591691 RepID=A0A5D3ARG5_9TREE|nr:hypothetical protein B9479_006595 [Cryptococcus floricola]